MDLSLIRYFNAVARHGTFSAAAKATYGTALARDGATAANLVRVSFAARGITF